MSANFFASCPRECLNVCQGAVTNNDDSSMVNPLTPNGVFNICCPSDCVSRQNGGTSGAPFKPLRVDSALRALSTLRGLRGAPEVPPLCRETQSLGQQMLNATLGVNGIYTTLDYFSLLPTWKILTGTLKLGSLWDRICWVFFLRICFWCSQNLLSL